MLHLHTCDICNWWIDFIDFIIFMYYYLIHLFSRNIIKEHHKVPGSYHQMQFVHTELLDKNPQNCKASKH